MAFARVGGLRPTAEVRHVAPVFHQRRVADATKQTTAGQKLRTMGSPGSRDQRSKHSWQFLRTLVKYSLFLLLPALVSGCTSTNEFVNKALSLPDEVVVANQYVVDYKGASLTASSEWDVIGYIIVASAVGAGARDLGTGLTAAEGSADPSKVSSNPRFAGLTEVNVGAEYEVVADKLLGTKQSPAGTAKGQTLQLTPHVNLHTESGNLIYQCDVTVRRLGADGKQTWLRKYKNVAGRVVAGGASTVPNADEFKTNAANCLGAATSAFAVHFSGDISRAFAAGQFRRGEVRYTPDRGQRSLYFDDKNSGLIFSIWGDGVEAIPKSNIVYLKYEQ